MKKLITAVGLAFVLAACGTGGAAPEPPQSGSEEDGKEIVSGREIIASLEQTATDTSIRDEKAEAVKEDETFKGGYLGEPTEELAAEMAVHQIEGQAAIAALEEIYGGYEGLNEAGVVFYENQSQGAEQTGIWFGVKEPDERLDEWLAVLQEQVDAGEILAEPVYVYRSPHSQKDLEALTYEASKKLKPMQEASHRPDIAVTSISADTITGALRIGHNFLSDEQQDELRAAFPEREVEFGIEGTVIPGPGEADVLYPDPAVVAELPDEGEYITDIRDEEILVGGTYYRFAGAGEKVEIGQRVIVESTGAIATSDPAQGVAVIVEVLPAYQPSGAASADKEAVRQALAESPGETNRYYTISRVEFDAANGEWLVELNQDGELYEIMVPDA